MMPTPSRHTMVYTSDGRLLGRAVRLYHRPENEVNPRLQLYARYLAVWDENTGSEYYVPTDFVAEPNGAQGELHLTVRYREVEQRTWVRKPQFVVAGQGRREELAPAG